MGQSQSEPSKDEVSRTNLSLLGIDVVTISGHSAIQKAINSGDLVKVNEACKIHELPWLFRNFFSVSRFHNDNFGFFLALLNGKDSSYSPRRAYLDSKFTTGTYDVSSYAKAAADTLEKPESNETNKELQEAFINALMSRFTPDNKGYPISIINEARKQVADVGESVRPIKAASSKAGVDAVCKFAQGVLRETGDLDKVSGKCPIDVGHVAFGSEVNSIPVLRALANNVDQSIEETLALLGPVENVPRMTTKDSTLGGLLDKPTKAKKTMVLLNIRSAAQETKDIAYTFGQGTTERRCACEPAILEFMKAVQVELQSRKKNDD